MLSIVTWKIEPSSLFRILIELIDLRSFDRSVSVKWQERKCLILFLVLNSLYGEKKNRKKKLVIRWYLTHSQCFTHRVEETDGFKANSSVKWLDDITHAIDRRRHLTIDLTFSIDFLSPRNKTNVAICRRYCSFDLPDLIFTRFFFVLYWHWSMHVRWHRTKNVIRFYLCQWRTNIDAMTSLASNRRREKEREVQ